MEELAEKKRKLEAIQAAREAKKRVIEQYRISNAHLSSSSMLSHLPKSSGNSSLSYHEQSTSVLVESMTSNTATSPKNEEMKEPFLQEIAAASLDSVGLPKCSQVECSHNSKQVPEMTVSLSTGAVAQPISERESAFKESPTQTVPQHQPSPEEASPRFIPEVPLASEKPPNARRHPQCFDHFRHWGGLKASEYGAAGARVAEVCALVPKLCLGEEDRLVVDIAVTPLPYKGGGADTAPCVAAAYAARGFFPTAPTDASVAGEAAPSHPHQADLPLQLRSSFPWGRPTRGAALLSSPSAPPTAAAAASSPPPLPLPLASSALAGLEALAGELRAVPGLVLAWAVLPGSALAGAMRGDSAADAARAGGQDVVVLTPLVCDAEVTTLLAHPFGPPGVLVAGTASGRVVMWNLAAAAWTALDRPALRARAVRSSGSPAVLVGSPQRPSASSFPSPQLHQGRVLALAVHGNASNHYLYSISQEGRVCTWSGWQTLQPIVARSAYFEGGGFMGNVGTVAVFASQRGSDSMTKVYIGTSGGAVIEGFNRNDRTIELHQCGLGGKANGYAGSTPLERKGGTVSGGKTASDPRGAQGGIPLSSLMGASLGLPGALADASGLTTFRSVRNRGRVIAMALQPPPMHVSFRDHDCVVAAFAHGSCVAYMGDTSIVMDGFVAMVTALRWSPTHPGIFAAGDAEGVVSLWDVYYSFSVPLLSVRLDQTSAGLGYGSPSGVEAVVVSMKERGGLRSPLDAGATFTMKMASAGHAQPIGSAIDGTSEAVTSLTFSADGRWLFSGVTAGNVYVLELSEELLQPGRGP